MPYHISMIMKNLVFRFPLARLLFIVLVSGSTISNAQVIPCDSEEALKLYEKGDSCFRTASYEKAAVLFEQAIKLMEANNCLWWFWNTMNKKTDAYLRSGNIE